MVINEQNAQEILKQYEKEILDSQILNDVLTLMDKGIQLFKTDENGEIWKETDENGNAKIEINEVFENKLLEKGYSEEEIEKVMNYLVASIVYQITQMSSTETSN